MLRALVFDLDGTLVDSERAYREALAQVGVDPGGDYAHARAAVKARLGAGHVAARNRLLYFKDMLQAQERFSPDATLSLMERYEQALTLLLAAQWRALDREPLLEKLRQRFAIGVLTNENTRTQLLKLRAIDPGNRFFSCVLTSEEVGCEKPDVRGFRLIAERLGVDAHECVFVGDNAPGDVVPALQIGSRAILTIEFGGGDPVPPGAECIARLDRLVEILDV